MNVNSYVKRHLLSRRMPILHESTCHAKSFRQLRVTSKLLTVWGNLSSNYPSDSWGSYETYVRNHACSHHLSWPDICNWAPNFITANCQANMTSRQYSLLLEKESKRSHDFEERKRLATSCENAPPPLQSTNIPWHIRRELPTEVVSRSYLWSQVPLVLR